MDLPPRPPPLDRQLNEAHWETAKATLESDPALEEVVVQRIPRKHVYVLRREKGEMRRLSSAEACRICDDIDVRRNIHTEVYARLGHFLCAKCLTTIQCSLGSYCSPSSSSSSSSGGPA